MEEDSRYTNVKEIRVRVSACMCKCVSVCVNVWMCKCVCVKRERERGCVFLMPSFHGACTATFVLYAATALQKRHRAKEGLLALFLRILLWFFSPLLSLSIHLLLLLSILLLLSSIIYDLYYFLCQILTCFDFPYFFLYILFLSLSGRTLIHDLSFSVVTPFFDHDLLQPSSHTNRHAEINDSSRRCHQSNSAGSSKLPPIAGPSPQPRRWERRPTPDECYYTIEKVFAVYIHIRRFVCMITY